ncbi:MAG: methyltransferase domain-containing protein [Bacteroidota bacterium]
MADKNNEEIWNRLVQHDVLCSRPRMDLTIETAKSYLTRLAWYGSDIDGKKVLCLACGGGQQSIAFALLGAEVTVVDFSEEQLKKDQEVAAAFKKEIRIVKSDMRDLSIFPAEEFDLVYQPYSINYIPSTTEVFDEVSRILKPNGIYDLMFHNPYVHGTWKDGCWGNEWAQAELWQGKGYPLWQPYKDGEPIQTHDPHWNFHNQTGEAVKIESPQEYRHTLSSIMNGLLSRNFEIITFAEEAGQDFQAEAGTWDHYQSIAPPWLFLVSKKK